MKVFIFPNKNGGVAIGYPAPECPLSIYDIAKKDLPPNTPFIIVDESELPKDHTFFDAWEADFSNPDGYGIGYDAWLAEQHIKQKSDGVDND